MGVDFAGEGLLDGLDGDARTARLELLERLEAEGASLDELRGAVRDGLLVFLLAERLVDGPPRHRLRDVAETAGVPLDLLVALRRANGLPVPDPDAVALTDLDVEAMRTAAAFRAAGVSDEQMLDVVRVLGRGMAQAAESMRTIGLELALEPGTSEAELARRFAERSAALVPMLGPMLEQMLRLHLRHAVGTEALGADERAAGTLPAAREVAVAFADLVGFTRLGEDVAPAELGAIAERLAALAGDLAEPPVRLVKTIGDAAMLVVAGRRRAARCRAAPPRRRRGRGRRVPAPADRRRGGPGRRARGRLVRAAGEPREPDHGDRAARERARHARGPRRRAGRVPVVAGRTAVAARGRRVRRALPRAARRRRDRRRRA